MDDSLQAGRTSSLPSALPTWELRAQRYWLVPGLFVLAGCAAFAIDLPIARFTKDPKPYPGFVREVLDITEAFGHAIGVGFILAAVALFDARGARRLPRLAAAALGAGLAADVFKLLLARTRPTAVDPSTSSVWATFGEWLPFFAGGHANHSFPSAHTAVAVGFAVALTHDLPRGRWLFAILAIACALQRIETEAHFPSDVCFGAAIGWVTAMICLHASGPSRFFARFENPVREDR